MTTKTKITLPSGNKPSIAVDPTKTTVTTIEVYDSGTPIDTWAEEVVREQRVLAQGDVKAHLADLEARRVAIEEGVMQRANHALYYLLSECLALATLAAENDPSNLRVREIDAFLVARKIKVGSNEPLFSKVISAVFGDVHRSRISSYRTVLKAASAAGISAAALPGWIESQGGVQEIRLASGGTGGTDSSEMARVTLEYLLDKGSVAALQSDALSKQLTIESNGKEVVLVATKQRDGTLMVHAAIEDAGCVKKALDVFQRKNQEAIKEFKYELKYRPGMRAA
jgi:hypothetical protein